VVARLAVAADGAAAVLHVDVAAVEAGLDQKRGADPRDDPTMSPGLRYADKDKPNG
jgi:hypothetical protein